MCSSDLRDIGSAILGPGAALWGEDAPTGGALQEMVVYSPAPAIYGGTDQVQRNILGERVLGLPKEPSNDRTMSWAELPRNG